jgi:hypothetical protein
VPEARDEASAFDIDDLAEWMEPKRNDKQFLAQVVVSIGVTCGLRVSEMQSMHNEDVYIDPKDNDLVIVVAERKTHKNGPTTFRIAKELDGPLSPWRYVERYAEMKKSSKLAHINEPNTKYFYQVRNDKIHGQVVGYNSFGDMMKEIAADLDLTGIWRSHSMRSTMATAGAEVMVNSQLMTHGGWRSSTVVDGYVKQSKASKREATKLLLTSTKAKIAAATTTTTTTTTTTQPLAIVPNFEQFAYNPVMQPPQQPTMTSTTTSYVAPQSFLSSFGQMSFPNLTTLTIIQGNQVINNTNKKRHRDSARDVENVVHNDEESND